MKTKVAIMITAIAAPTAMPAIAPPEMLDGLLPVEGFTVEVELAVAEAATPVPLDEPLGCEDVAKDEVEVEEVVVVDIVAPRMVEMKREMEVDATGTVSVTQSV